MTAVVSLSLVLWIAFALFVAAVLLLTFRYIPNDRVGIVEKLWSPSGSVTSGLIALERRGRLPARRAARRLALADAVPVPRPQDAAGHDPAGEDRLRLRARRAAAAADADARVATSRADDFQDVRGVPAQRRPARTAAQDPARGHLRHQPRAVRRRHRASASISCRSTARKRRPSSGWRWSSPSATASSRS